MLDVPITAILDGNIMRSGPHFLGKKVIVRGIFTDPREGVAGTLVRLSHHRVPTRHGDSIIKRKLWIEISDGRVIDYYYQDDSTIELDTEERVW